MPNDAGGKYVADSQTEQAQVVMPLHLNGHDSLFGGQLAMWIDILAGIVARRHCGKRVTTAAIDNLRFREPVCQNEMLVLRGKMTHAGTTSMEVRVDSYVEDGEGGRRLINTAFAILVALGEDGRPCRVPALIPKTPEEKREFAAGIKRREMRLKYREELYE